MYPSYHYAGHKQVTENRPLTFPGQHQGTQPGIESQMNPRPLYDNPEYTGSGKLSGKTAIITGGDSGIGRAVAVAFAKEGADLGIIYLDETPDAEETKGIIEKCGHRCILIKNDITSEANCGQAVQTILDSFGHLDILVNNAAVQYPQNSILDITAEQLDKTFKTNIFSMFYMIKATLPRLASGSSIINTASVTAYQGNKTLLDYSSTKGAVVSLTRSLSLSLVSINVRVNAVAPGPVWTPLIVSSFAADQVEAFGTDVPMKRAAQPFELAPAYVYLAGSDSAYVTGQVIHVNGGTITGS